MPTNRDAELQKHAEQAAFIPAFLGGVLGIFLFGGSVCSWPLHHELGGLALCRGYPGVHCRTDRDQSDLVFDCQNRVGFPRSRVHDPWNGVARGGLCSGVLVIFPVGR